MSDTESPNLGLDEASIHSFITRVQRIDPAASDAAIRRFLSEMDEARKALDGLETRDAPMPVAYSPAWPEERE